jgi:hypothetical protein
MFATLLSSFRPTNKFGEIIYSFCKGVSTGDEDRDESDSGFSQGIAKRKILGHAVGCWELVQWCFQVLKRSCVEVITRLDAGGKEVLIKSVAQAIPTYSMSSFKLPRGLCQHINSLL